MRYLLLSCAFALFILSSFGTGRKNKLRLPEEFVEIPGGQFHLTHPGKNIKSSNTTDSVKLITVAGFFMSKYEVSNQQYRQFFAEVAPGLTEAERASFACDTSGWDMPISYDEPLKKYYYTHPAYSNFPVVNVSYEGAAKYCRWLEQKIQNDNPAFEIEVKLPSKEEWIWAAMGGRKQAMFPWGNYYLRNRKGEPMCNFRVVNDGAIYRNRITGKAEVAEPGLPSRVNVFTATVKSFYPNDYRLYNMCGNAAEIIGEKGIAMGGSWNDFGGDVHIRAEGKYERSSPAVGFRPIVIVKEKK